MTVEEAGETEASDEKESNSSIFIYLLLIIIGIFIMIGLIGYIDARYCRINDFFSISTIVITLFQVLDLSSDIFLSISIYQQINTKDQLYEILFILSLVFIILPIIISIYQLWHQIKKHWWKQDHIKLWLRNNDKLLYFLSIFLGSSFSATQFVNSNLFSKYMFSMGLSNIDRIRFQTKRYSVVILEVNLSMF